MCVPNVFLGLSESAVGYFFHEVRDRNYEIQINEAVIELGFQ